MKNLTFLVLVLAVVVSAVISSFGQTADAVAQRLAEASAAMAKLRPLPYNQVANWSTKSKNAKNGMREVGDSAGAPAILFLSYGNSKSGMTVQAYNAKELPDGTTIYARKYIRGGETWMGWTVFGGNMPAGLFMYPFEDGTRATWTEFSGVNVYEIFVNYPDGSVSSSSFSKVVNKFYSGMYNTEKLIISAEAKYVRGSLIVEVSGPIATAGSGNISVMIEDPDVDFDQWIPAFEVRRGKLFINLTLYGQEIPEGGEFNILVGNSYGQTDQYPVRIPRRPQAVGKEQ